MQIGTRKIGPSEPPLVIAEIGINHGGDLRGCQTYGIAGCAVGL